MDFANYNLDPGIFDEMFLPDGSRVRALGCCTTR